jgi:hypothetical protein
MAQKSGLMISALEAGRQIPRFFPSTLENLSQVVTVGRLAPCLTFLWQFNRGILLVFPHY